MKNTSASWFYESRQNKYYKTDSINHLKDAMIYGVTFMLWAEQDKTDEQLIEELNNDYPGNYQCVKTV
ncbi:chalcone isomerase domain-containing protein [Dyadobacter sp. CY323]|uniref:chalcone isomerase domain-containing protein n=1 Tax=Dyadobacter sp. CY323 TaxID=2907302 RepID=UPI001F1DA060|nr:chalcone isomerase domain-containing protein [Dyadobacter sp. CY323]MCE6988995.1 chalcone isomerase domain-containing protein [Dyadobacter sp. CY323]